MPDDLNQQSLAVTLVVTPELRNMLLTNANALDEVKAYTIDSTEVAQMVAEEMNAIKQRGNRLVATKAEFVKPAMEIVTAANNLFNAPIKALQDAEAWCKGLLRGWDEKERNRIALENQKREDEARKIRQEAEARAAAERARAEEQAAQKRREEEAERRKADEARAAGNARAAAAAEAAAAKLAEQATAAVETGNAKAAQAELEASVSVPAAPVAVAQAVAGVQYRDNWVPKLKERTDEETAKRLIILQAADDFQGRGDTQLFACLEIDMTTVRRLAKGLKGQMRVPGFEAVNERQVAGKNK